MGIDEQNPEREKQARAFAFRVQTSEAIQNLMRSQAPLDQIAKMLGAEDFLVYEMPRSNQAPVLHFNVEAFIDDQIRTGRYLRLPDSFVDIKKVILPPDAGEIKEGRGGGLEPKEFIPRSRFLVEVLSQMGQGYSVVKGTNEPEMLRALSYLAVEVPELKKLVLVNDEEGNATFIIHDIDQSNISPIMGMTKEQLKQAEYKVSVLIYPGDEEKWKTRMIELLNEPYSPKKKRKNKYNGRVDTSGYEYAPADWRTNRSLNKELGVAQTLIHQIADEYRASKPEWFVVYLDKGNRKFEYYHPDLVAIIESKLGAREKAPENWQTASGLAETLGADEGMIKRLLVPYRSSNPDWFKAYYKYGHSWEHLSPQLCEVIANEINSRGDPAPEGWQTAGELKNSLGFRATLDTIVDRYRKTHPDSFKLYLNKAGRPSEYLHPTLVALIEEEVSNIGEVAPKGWETITSFAQENNTTYGTIARYAELYREKHPEWFKDYLVPKNKLLTEHLDPQLQIKIREHLKERREAPTSWFNCSALSKQLDVSYQLVYNTANQYRDEHPEWFVDYLDSMGKTAEFYDPQLVALVASAIKERGEPAPEGWLTKDRLAKELDASYPVVDKLVKKLKIAGTHPEWIRIYLAGSGRPYEHYHPDLVGLMRTLAEAPEESWLDQAELARELGLTLKRTSELAARFKESNPGWLTYRLQSGRVEEYFHPDLVAMMKDESMKLVAPEIERNKLLAGQKREREKLLVGQEESPEGWLTVGQLCESLSAQRPTILKLAAPYRSSNPEYFHNYVMKGKRILVEHMDPTLVKLIAETIKNKAPEGWANAGELAAKHGIAHNVIIRLEKLYAKDQPEWVKKYNLGSRKINYYHPDLVQKIEEDLNRREEPPEGWLTYHPLAEKLQVDWQTAVKWVKPYKQSNPEWFKEYLDRSNTMTEHIHPELVELLTARVKKEFTRRTPGWLSTSEAADQVGISGHIVSKIVETYREAHPEWFVVHRNTRNVPTEYFDPELIKLIATHAEGRNKPAPAGWLTIGQLADAAGMELSTLRRRVDKLLNEKDHPGKYGIFLDKKNRLSLHYDPDLVDKLKT